MSDVEKAIRAHPEGSLIAVKVRPSSTRHAVEGLSGDRIAISVHSPAEKGKANKEALKALSESMGIAPSGLEIIRGHSSRNKIILARGVTPAEVRKSLGE